MDSGPPPYALLSVVTALVASAIAASAWHHRRTAGATEVSVRMDGTTGAEPATAFGEPFTTATSHGDRGTRAATWASAPGTGRHVKETNAGTGTDGANGRNGGARPMTWQHTPYALVLLIAAGLVWALVAYGAVLVAGAVFRPPVSRPSARRARRRHRRTA